MTRFIFYITVMLFLCSSCNKQNTTKEKTSDFKTSDVYEYIHLIPDSLRTPEQQEFCRLFEKLMVRYMDVKDNHMYFKLNRQQFIDSGIPGPYFDILQQNIKENNAYFDSLGLTNVDSILKASYAPIREKYKILEARK